MTIKEVLPMASKEYVDAIKQCIAEGKWLIDTENGTVIGKRGSTGNITKGGYILFHVRLNGKRYHPTAHEIIAIAGGLDIVDKDVDHIDNNKLNNRLDNLQAIPHKENFDKACKDKLMIAHYGESNGSAKLTWKLVEQIRKEYREGCSQMFLSRKYNVHKNTIWNIVNNKKWIKGED